MTEFFRRSRRALALAVLSWLVIGIGAPARAGTVVTTVGAPTFTLADFHLFAAPIGTAASGYAELVKTLQAILPPPNHQFDPTLGIVPGAPHPGPYDQEIAKGMAANGFVDSTTFTTADFSNGTGIFWAFMIVPGPGSPVGSSPDFASGPILPNAMFPLTSSARTFVNGVFNGSAGGFVAPAVDQLPGFQGLEGYSHVPFFYIDSLDFTNLKIAGNYEFRDSLLDAPGNGYRLVVSFQVVPEPHSWVMLATACLVLVGLIYSRRQPSS